MRPHHTLSYPERPDRAYIGYIDAGIVILDIADKAHPKLISRLDYHPPYPGFTHTVLPLFERDLLVVTDEATGGPGSRLAEALLDRGREAGNEPGDDLEPADAAGFRRTAQGGRPHRRPQHPRERAGAGQRQTAEHGGLDVVQRGRARLRYRRSFRPEEIAAFLPETPTGQRGCRISDVFVDDRQIIYAADRANGGLYVLEYLGKRPLN